jgi:peptide/nickel transport system substrate-binding protein
MGIHVIGRRRQTASGAVALAITLALVLSACQSSSKSTSDSSSNGGSAAVAGGKLTVAGSQEMPSYDPVDVRVGELGQNRALWVYDSLLRQNKDGSITGQLALSMTTKDSKTWTMKLRPGVKFSDGTPLDAEAVVFNVKRHQDPANGSSSYSSLIDLAKVTALDATTVVYVLKAANPRFPVAFDQFQSAGLIASPTALKADPAGFRRKPVGAGPFTLTEWVTDDHTTFSKNTKYRTSGHPYLNTIVFRPMAQSITGQAVLSGDVDWASVNGAFAVQNKSNNKLAFYSGNDSNSGSGLVFNTKKAPGNDVRVRQAVMLAVQPHEMNQIGFGGLWNEDMGCPPFSASSPLCDPGVWPKPDLSKAKQLIADYVKDGNSPEVVWNELTPGLPEFAYLQQQMTAIGLKVKIKAVDSPQSLSDEASGNFQLMFAGISPFYDPYPGVFTMLYSKGRNTPKANFPELDAALERARDATSITETAKAWKEVQQINVKNALFIWYGPYLQPKVTSKNVDMGADYDGKSVFFGDEVSIRR